MKQSFQTRLRVARCLGCALLVASATAQAQPDSAWAHAVALRASFDAQPAHTRADYKRVLDAYRAVYYSTPQDLHAPFAIEQTAVLFAQQGRELRDARSPGEAVSQCSFLVKGYPRSSAARHCSGEIAAIAATPANPTGTLPKTAENEASSGSGPAEQDGSGDGQARVTGIRHWSTANYTRVAIDLGGEVEYQAARVEDPDRIFFDIHHAHLAPELVGKTFTVTDGGFLSSIRASQSSPDVTRVVLDVHGAADYSAFLLPNPYRLIVDIRGREPDTASRDAGTRAAGTSAAGTRQAGASDQGAGNRGQASAATAQAVGVSGGSASSLPPMPVTDGSAAFGLPPKNGPRGETAAPRVVIPSKPTSAKPVPNTVTTAAASSGSDVAAVSAQPGKVEATRRPTAAPVSETVDRPASTGTRKPKAGDAAAAPAPAALPTADGQTSMMRALGLKIGRIVIDAGHGGHDSGTLGAGGIQEKDVVLDVALRLGRLLHERLGAEVVYTRADDTFIPLETRTAIANKAQADLFLSVHANSSQDPSARGVEVYYLNFASDPEALRVASRENAVSNQSVHELSDLVKKITLKDKIDESRELATDVDESLYAGLAKGNDGLKNRGVKKAPFVVLIGADMPSILAEISFVTNPADAAELRTPEYRQRVAESLYAGVAKYAASVNGTRNRVPLTHVASRR